MPDYRYRAFITYSHRDSDWADWLHLALEDYSIPPRLVGLTTGAGVIPRRLAPIFRDRDELPSATDLSRKVSEVLAQSECLIVICSPHSAQSRWVDEEVRAFQQLGRAQRIFCFIVDGEPGASAWAGREHDECFAPSLRQRLDAAGEATGETFEPIAADARPGKDGKANARMKLIAGMLGVDLDDLKHRERRRRRWRAVALTGLGAALLAVTTTLAINAVIARHAAERRQKQAEDLVGYMLGDLDDKLREVNRLDILESVADKVVKYFATLPPSDLSDGALAQRAKALLKLGSVRRDQGRIKEAVDAFDEALATSERLVRMAPGNSEYQTINAESLTWLGFVDWSQGRLDSALRRFEAARDTLLRVSASRPDDADLLDRLNAARTNAGRVFEARGQVDEARREYASVLDGYSYLSRREPDKLEWRTELGYAHNNLAQLASKEGNLEEAVREYIADREIKANLFALDPTNNSRREDLVASEAFLGRVLYMCGDTNAAALHLHAAMDGIERLLLLDPAATDWLDKAGSYGWMLGQVARVQGDAPAAQRHDTTAIARMAQLARKDGGNVGWQRKLAQAQAENARRLLALTQVAAANEAAKSAAAAIEHAVAGAADDLSSKLVAAQVQVVLGDVALAAGNPSGAKAHWTAASASLGPRAGSSRDPSLLDVWIGAQLRLGERAAADAALEMLSNTPYREPDFMTTLEQHGIQAPPAGAASQRISQLASGISDRSDTSPD